MPNEEKRNIIILVSVLTICLLPFIGFRAFVNAIRNQRTCEWANIDNIELHAHIDVPKVTKWDCNYEKEYNTKRASFTVDTNHFNVNEFIQGYKLRKLGSSSEVEHVQFLNLKMESLNGSDLYYKRNPPGEERYDVLLDKTTGRLWVTIQYKN